MTLYNGGDRCGVPTDLIAEFITPLVVTDIVAVAA